MKRFRVKPNDKKNILDNEKQITTRVEKRLIRTIYILEKEEP